MSARKEVGQQRHAACRGALVHFPLLTSTVHQPLLPACGESGRPYSTKLDPAGNGRQRRARGRRDGRRQGPGVAGSGHHASRNTPPASHLNGPSPEMTTEACCTPSASTDPYPFLLPLLRPVHPALRGISWMDTSAWPGSERTASRLTYRLGRPPPSVRGGEGYGRGARWGGCKVQRCRSPRRSRQPHRPPLPQAQQEPRGRS